jgi:hypothetical protein
MTRKERREAMKEPKLERWFKDEKTKRIYRKWLKICKCPDGGNQKSLGYCSRCERAIPYKLEDTNL